MNLPTTDIEFIDIERELINSGASNKCKGRRIYLTSLKSGYPISGAEVARQCSMSERWGQDCVREVREFIKSHDGYYGSELIALAQTRPVSTPQSLPTVAETTTPSDTARPAAPAIETRNPQGNPQVDGIVGPSEPLPLLAGEVDRTYPQSRSDAHFAGAAGEAQPARSGPQAEAQPTRNPQNDSDSHFAGYPQLRTAPASHPQPEMRVAGAAPTDLRAETPEPHRPATPGPHPHSDPQPANQTRKPVRIWAVWFLMLSAAAAIWGGWVGLGEMAGFGVINLLPGITNLEINTAITLPIGMEAYAAFALYVWLSGRVSGRALTFARRSTWISLTIGSLGQVAYHIMNAAGIETAPWQITAAVACLPVAVLGMGAALAHLVIAEREQRQP